MVRDEENTIILNNLQKCPTITCTYVQCTYICIFTLIDVTFSGQRKSNKRLCFHRQRYKVNFPLGASVS